MAAYAALLSLAQTTDLNTTPDDSLLASGAEEKVRSINDYVNFLLLFFEEFPEKVKRWEGRIRDVAHETEDIIEVFMGQRIQARRNSIMTPSLVRLENQLENVMEKIGLIAGEVMEERPAYKPSSSSSSSRSSSTGNDAVVGLDDDIMAMKERLCGHSSNLQVIPIVGMGGIGKSTLATTLYEDPLIVETFHIRAFVVVSQDYSPVRFRRLLLGLIKRPEEQISETEMDESSQEQVSETEMDESLKVYQILKGWKYLVVIDDVWGIQFWDDVRFMFPDDNNGSRIILTTRLLDVAVYPYSAGPVHEMRFMNDSQSWDLLKLKVFGNGNCPSELEEVGKEIARRCAGLPLAVVLVAGVLSRENNTRASWESIGKNVSPVVGREIEEILSLSYNYLPLHLRPCFLFIGGFLEDTIIQTSRLIRLWVAEGFVKRKNGCSKSSEEEAEEYLEDLAKRNLVIVTSRKSDGKIKYCSLHDMVRGLCIRNAHQEKFLHVMDERDLPQGLMNERHISFRHSDIADILGPTCRTILCFRTQSFPSLLGGYILLRVLDVLGVDLKVFPSSVFELYHLRYLALMGSFSIPSLICNLVNLQMLIIHVASGKLRAAYDNLESYSLPVEIWRMPKLRYLFLHSPCMLPHPLEGMNRPLENLDTLSFVKDLVWNGQILQMIPKVKRLGLHYTSNQEYHLHHLKDLHQLEKLKVIGHPDFLWRRQNPSFPRTLKRLTLIGGGFPWENMAPVGSLPCLEILKLLDYACAGETWETTDEEFPQLKVLLIDTSHLQQWKTQGHSLPTLKRLVLRSCWHLEEIPEGIGEIPTLELIEIDSCTKSVVESAKKIKEDQESYGNHARQVRASHEDSMDDEHARFAKQVKEMYSYKQREFCSDLVWNEEIAQLIPNVKRLGLTYTKINQECDLHLLKDMHHLEKLEVIGYMGFSWRGQSRPSFPCTLKKLTLVNVGVPWRDMAVVGQLPNLETLKLLRHACKGQTWEANDEDFPGLRFLLIGDSHLQQWITQSKPFPTLKRLVLRSCESLVEFPEAIGEIPTLELIDLYYCANSLVASAMKIKEDQESYGNCALQVRAYSYFEGSSSTELSSNASSDYSPRQHKVPSHFLCPISQFPFVAEFAGGYGRPTCSRRRLYL